MNLKCLSLILLLLLGAWPDAQSQPRRRNPRASDLPRQEELRPAQQEIFRFLEEYFPERARRLKQLRETSPEEFRQKRQNYLEEILRLMHLRDENPELFRLQIEELKLRGRLELLGREYRQALVDERVKIEQRLLEQLERAFDLRQRIKEMEARDLELRLEELKQGLENRKQRREELIDQRFRELVGESASDW